MRRHACAEASRRYSVAAYRELGGWAELCFMLRVTWWWLMVTIIAFKCEKCCAASTWVHLRTIGSEGAGNGQFNAPFGVAFEGMGHIVVSDSVGRRVQVLRYIDGAHVFVPSGDSTIIIAVGIVSLRLSQSSSGVHCSRAHGRSKHLRAAFVAKFYQFTVQIGRSKFHIVFSQATRRCGWRLQK